MVSLASRLDLHYLQRSGRFSGEEAHRVWALTDEASANVSAEPITAAIVERFDSPALSSLPDPWDRLTTATAMQLGVPLVTKDRAISAVGEAGEVQIVW